MKNIRAQSKTLSTNNILTLKKKFVSTLEVKFAFAKRITVL